MCSVSYRKNLELLEPLTDSILRYWDSTQFDEKILLINSLNGDSAGTNYVY